MKAGLYAPSVSFCEKDITTMKKFTAVVLLLLFGFASESVNAQNQLKYTVGLPQYQNQAASEMQKMLAQYQTEALELFKAVTQAEWEAMTTGTEEAFQKSVAQSSP